MIQLTLTGEDGGADRSLFEVGESLVLSLTGLAPIQPYEVRVELLGSELFTCRFISDRNGVIDSTVVWGRLGMDDPNSATVYSYPQALVQWQGKVLDLTIKYQGAVVTTRQVTIASTTTRAFAVNTNASGVMLNGFEVGTQNLYVSLYNLTFGSTYRIYMVQRQHRWETGNSFQPVTLNNSTPAQVDVVFSNVQGITVQVASAQDVPIGAFDFIMRAIEPDYHDVYTLGHTDIVLNPFLTSVVVRDHPNDGKVIQGGCAVEIPMSGRTLNTAPYFYYTNVFEIGDDVHAALDPGILPAANLGKMCALYVVKSKTAAEWDADTSLTHLAVLGGNAAVQKIKVDPGCINLNRVLVWPNALEPDEYDIIADFGNNTPNAAAFANDHNYDCSIDLIDGYIGKVGGFRIVEDPAELTDNTIAEVGKYEYLDPYNEGDSVHAVKVMDETNLLYESGTPDTTQLNNVLEGEVYFPSTMLNATTPSQIKQGTYPLLVMMHGGGQNYKDYEFSGGNPPGLLRHLARNGFIVASINVSGLNPLGIANALFRHLSIIHRAFGSSVEQNIGLIGHSRGGEAVVKAAKINKDDAKGYNINAIISLAPTDSWGSPRLQGNYTAPYFVLYGSQDVEVNGGYDQGWNRRRTGFSLYDRASGAIKSMLYIHGANHSGFLYIGEDKDYLAQEGKEDGARMLTPETHRLLTKGYMNAFFRWHLKGEAQWKGLFTGEWMPRSVTQKIVEEIYKPDPINSPDVFQSKGMKLLTQYQDTVHRVVDNFDDNLNDWQKNALGGSGVISVQHIGLPITPTEGWLMRADANLRLDTNSPHDTRALKVQWNQMADVLLFHIPSGSRDVRNYEVLSFRAARTENVLNPSGRSVSLRVSLTDSGGGTRSILSKPFGEIVPAYIRGGQPFLTGMRTVRIPLSAWTIQCGVPPLDLQNIVEIRFRFVSSTTGEVVINDVEFSA